MKTLAFTVTRASTHNRANLLFDTIESAREAPGEALDWFMYLSGCGEHIAEVEKLRFPLSDKIQCIVRNDHNVGQHVAWNEAYQYALAQDYDYLLRIDDDCEFPSKRWLAKLIEASRKLDDAFILSPLVRGLKNTVSKSQVCTVNGLQLEFLVDAIGGICRLHPISLLKKYNFVADVRKALGSGDATGIASWCRTNTIFMAYLKTVRVKHARGTASQERTDPEHFANHSLFQAVPYIPPWRPAAGDAA